MRPSTPILHVDLDAFYASVEQLLDPRLRGKPVLVGGGVVLAASYEARSFGVSAPMGVRQALALCPDAVVVSGSFDRYSELSDRVMKICRDHTPLVEQISIDEAFLDVSGSVHLLGSPTVIGRMIRDRVRGEIGLAVSVGVASTKFLAKVASGQAKPDGLIVVEPPDEISWLHALPVSVIWGVGPVTAARLAERGVATVGDLAAIPSEALTRWLGPHAGGHLRALAWNHDPRTVMVGGRAGSVGAQSALGRGLDDPDDLGRVLLALADRVSGRLRKKGRAGRTLTVRVRFADMSRATRANTLPSAVCSTAALHHAGLPLLASARQAKVGPLTLVGISVSKLEDAGPIQLELPFPSRESVRDAVVRSGSAIGAAHQMVDEQVDRARARFGKGAVGRASMLLDPHRSVPDAFRELAERD